MAKRIAVLVREKERQGEAMRMSLGLILLDDITDVYVLEKMEYNKSNMHYIDTFKEMDMKVYTNCRDNKDMEYLASEEIAGKLLDYDNILPY